MKRKLSALFVLLVCALAAATSLTPIVAKALSAPQGNEQECRARLAALARAIADYKRNHGTLPANLDNLGVPSVCPESGEAYEYRAFMGPEEILEHLWTQEQIRGLRELLDHGDWAANPIVICGWHYNPDTVYLVHYDQEGRRWLEGHFNSSGVEFLGASLEGQVGYWPFVDQMSQSISEYYDRNPMERR